MFLSLSIPDNMHALLRMLYDASVRSHDPHCFGYSRTRRVALYFLSCLAVDGSGGSHRCFSIAETFRFRAVYHALPTACIGRIERNTQPHSNWSTPTADGSYARYATIPTAKGRSGTGEPSPKPIYILLRFR